MTTGGYARRQIEEQLRALELEHDVRILYACESGSRAWGFASPDSDYDVRFVYVRPVDWYLSIDHRRDVIEYLDHPWDLSGWDLRKALHLFRKSNPPLLEWLRSPIVYRSAGPAICRMRRLQRRFAYPRTTMHHYLHMALKNWRQYLQGDPPNALGLPPASKEVWTKKYFYVLRPLLACRWIETWRGPVPMELARMMDPAAGLGRWVTHALVELLTEKRAGAELRLGPRIPVLDDFIREEFARHDAAGLPFPKVLNVDRPDPEPLNAIFRDEVLQGGG